MGGGRGVGREGRREYMNGRTWAVILDLEP